MKKIIIVVSILLIGFLFINKSDKGYIPDSGDYKGVELKSFCIPDEREKNSIPSNATKDNGYKEYYKNYNSEYMTILKFNGVDEKYGKKYMSVSMTMLKRPSDDGHLGCFLS